MRTLIALPLATAAIVFAVWWFTQRTPGTTSSAERQNKVLTAFDRSTLDGLRIRCGGPEINLRRDRSRSGDDLEHGEVEDWRMTAPQSLEVDQEVVSSLLSVLEWLAPERQLHATPEERTRYLDGGCRVDFLDRSGATFWLRVGSDAPEPGHLYVYASGRDTVMVVAADELTRELRRNAYDFANHRPLSTLAPGDVTEVAISDTLGEYVVRAVRHEHIWRQHTDPSVRYQTTSVNHVLTLMQNLVFESLAEPPASVGSGTHITATVGSSEVSIDLIAGYCTTSQTVRVSRDGNPVAYGCADATQLGQAVTAGPSTDDRAMSLTTESLISMQITQDNRGTLSATRSETGWTWRVGDTQVELDGSLVFAHVSRLASTAVGGHAAQGGGVRLCAQAVFESAEQDREAVRIGCQDSSCAPSCPAYVARSGEENYRATTTLLSDWLATPN